MSDAIVLAGETLGPCGTVLWLDTILSRQEIGEARRRRTPVSHVLPEVCIVSGNAS
jgi:hypothetical protein